MALIKGYDGLSNKLDDDFNAWSRAVQDNVGKLRPPKRPFSIGKLILDAGVLGADYPAHIV